MNRDNSFRPWARSPWTRRPGIVVLAIFAPLITLAFALPGVWADTCGSYRDMVRYW